MQHHKRLLTDEELYERHSNTFELVEAYDEDASETQNFLDYLYRRFKLARFKQMKKRVKECMELLASSHQDYNKQSNNNYYANSQNYNDPSMQYHWANYYSMLQLNQNLNQQQQYLQQAQPYIHYPHASTSSSQQGEKAMAAPYSSRVSDYEVYNLFRQLMFANNVVLSEQQLNQQDANDYHFTVSKKIEEMRTFLSSASTILPEINSLKNVLDVGTERLEFLDELEKSLSIREHAHGINIDTGYCHYDESFKQNLQDKRFQLYNGKTIPFENSSFEFMTMFSVVHHVSKEDFVMLAKELARVCSGYLFFKDVDLAERVHQILFKAQHLVYGGILCPSESVYI